MSKASLIHFPCLESRKVQIQFLNCEKYVGTIEKLTSAFETRFEDFKKHNVDVQLFAHPFDLVVENTPPSFQLEIIELQANVDLKQAYHENDLLTFYRSYVYGNYTNLENHARKMISLFGSTYCCEQFFSKMKLFKTKCRNQLTDEHLTSQLRIATSSVKADIGKICGSRRYQISH